MEQAYKLCLLGATDDQLADFFCVSPATVDLWKRAYCHFSDALKRGKVIADATVAESLYKTANGFSLTKTLVNVIEGKVEKTDIVENYPPNVTAGIFWLKNRNRKIWNDKYQVDVTHYDDIIRPIEIVTPDDWQSAEEEPTHLLEKLSDYAPEALPGELPSIAENIEIVVQAPPEEKQVIDTPHIKREIYTKDDNGKVKRQWPYQ